MEMLTLAQRNAWCDALRSGHYGRCAGLMRAGNSQCALGLGLRVLGMTEWQLGACLPHECACIIARMNDALEVKPGQRPMFRYTWSHIADWIEDNVPVVEFERQFVEISRDENSATIQQADVYAQCAALMYPPPSYAPSGLAKILEMFKKQISEACSV